MAELLEGARTLLRRVATVISRVWRSQKTTKVLLYVGMVAAGLYVVGDVVSGLIYDASRPYSFTDQWISELTASVLPFVP